MFSNVSLNFTDSAQLKVTVDETTGFLTAPVTLARVGVQHYMGHELGLIDRAMEKIGVYRSRQEVFSGDSIKSYVNLIVTDDHPSELVTVSNVKKLQKGTTSDIKPNQETLSGIVTFTDSNLIKKIKDGKVEVSVGYSNILKEEKGTFQGVDYEFIQTDIIANHLAIVDAGRCGPACRLTLDNGKKENIMIVTIDGIDFDIEDKQLGQAVSKMKATHDAEKEEMKNRFKKKEEEDEEEKEKLKSEKEEMKGKKDKSDAKADALKDSVLDPDALNLLISDRAKLLVEARTVLGDKMPECIDCPIKIKSAVIDNVMPGMTLDGKSDEYINAAYDMAIEKIAKAGKTIDKLTGDFKAPKGDGLTREGARGKYMKDQLNIEED